MRRFAGRWLLGVSAIHTVFALVVFRAELGAMARDGFVATVGTDARRGAVAWFLLFGGALALAAVVIDELEAKGASLRRAGLVLAALTTAGVVWMPASGFWLAVPAIAVMLRRRRVTAT